MMTHPPAGPSTPPPPPGPKLLRGGPASPNFPEPGPGHPPQPTPRMYVRGEPLPKPTTGEPPPPPTPRFAPLASLRANPALAHASPGLSAAPRPTPTG